LTVVLLQFDGIVLDDLEAPIVSDEIRYEKSGKFIVDV
jgi:hypothetical protein